MSSLNYVFLLKIELLLQGEKKCDRATVQENVPILRLCTRGNNYQ